MDFGHLQVRQTRRAGAAILLVIGFTAFAGGCEGKGDRPSRDLLPAGNAPLGGSAVTTDRQGGTSLSPLGGFSVTVAPSFPSRIVPPTVSVKSPPGKGAEVLDVRWQVNGAEAGSGQPLRPDAFRRGDRLQAKVILRAGAGEKSFTTPEVVAVNALPAASDVRIEPRAPICGGIVRAVAQAQDPDGDPVTFKYQWYVNDLLVAGYGDTLTLIGVKKGSWVHVTVTPNDGFSDGAWRDSSRHQVANGLPVVRSALPKELSPGRRFSYRIVAEDPDGDPLSYTLTKAPPGMLLKGSTLEWQVPEEAIGEKVEVVVVISDDDGGQTIQNISMTIRKP